MNGIWRHIIHQPFIAATGAAALLHSTWSLGTLFAGVQPEPGNIVALAGWLVPALLIAFALDVGQIVTSAEIRKDGLTFARGATFLTFALATYYLQWIYIAHHMPALPLGEGVSASWSGTALVMRDAAIWIIPALLPASTLLYTFSGKQKAHPAPEAVAPAAPLVAVSAPNLDRLPPPLGDEDTEPIEVPKSRAGGEDRVPARRAKSKIRVSATALTAGQDSPVMRIETPSTVLDDAVLPRTDRA